MVAARTWLLAIGAAAVAGLATVWLLYPAPLRPRTVTVPALRGLPGNDAVVQLTEAGLRGRIGQERADPLVPSGTVSWQSPPQGMMVPESTVVQIGLSSGPSLVAVPDVRDLDRETAREILEAAGLVIGRLDSIRSSVPAGLILRTSPEPRAAARAGSSISITLSRGPQENRSDRQNRAQRTQH